MVYEEEKLAGSTTFRFSFHFCVRPFGGSDGGSGGGGSGDEHLDRGGGAHQVYVMFKCVCVRTSKLGRRWWRPSPWLRLDSSGRFAIGPGPTAAASVAAKPMSGLDGGGKGDETLADGW
ncbi:hypothetical protein QTP88_023267 [Uroleucon formosanum]